jgi:hypothetical protein
MGEFLLFGRIQVSQPPHVQIHRGLVAAVRSGQINLTHKQRERTIY